MKRLLNVFIAEYKTFIKNLYINKGNGPRRLTIELPGEIGESMD